MDRLWQVRVPGPLGPYARGFRENLLQQGYSSWTVVWDLTVMRRLSDWMTAHRLGLNELTITQVERFVRADRKARGRGPRGMTQLVAYLRGQGVVAQSAPAAVDELGKLLEDFTIFLVEERGLAAGTIWYYRSIGQRFLKRFATRAGQVEFGSVTAEAVRAFVIGESTRRSVGSVKNVVTALRALLRFLHVRGYLASGLADAVPAIAKWHRQSLPATPQDGEIAQLLAGCDRDTDIGRRDYAILVLLTRLGLRISEVAALRLDDVGWRAGEILICGKGNRRDRLPLPTDVGAAIADYCRWGRRESGSRALFLHARAPYGAMASCTIGRVVGRACDRARLARIRPHRLRHAAATTLRRAGAPLFEIGQVLRHAHPVTTAGYGSIDVLELAVAARSWPAGAQ